jgi:hypothetical protein
MLFTLPFKGVRTGHMVDTRSETWWTGHARDRPAFTLPVVKSILAIRRVLQ